MFDERKDLRERFDYAAYFYLSAWENDPEMRIEGNVIVRDQAKEDFEAQMVDTFEVLRDTVDAVPDSLISKATQFISALGEERSDGFLVELIQRIGRAFLPATATEFVTELNNRLENVLRE